MIKKDKGPPGGGPPQLRLCLGGGFSRPIRGFEPPRCQPIIPAIPAYVTAASAGRAARLVQRLALATDRLEPVLPPRGERCDGVDDLRAECGALELGLLRGRTTIPGGHDRRV